MENLRYPIGKFQPPANPSTEEVRRAIEVIAECPRQARAAVAGLSDAQLDTPYREGGWTVRQVVHHVADSHMNAYIRTKLAVTEDHPRVKTYEESDWARLEDAMHAPVEVSLALLEALHERWVRFLRSLPDDAFARAFEHPDSGHLRVHWLVFLYEWHGRHHVAHITSLRQRMGWK
jgi:uncharacterized damage-inducible protein DinB